MLDLRRLRCFAAVAETLHFGRAAQRLHMAQPPLTRQISALEEELGFRLFDRSSRAVTLTAEGSLFLPYARGLLDQLERTAGFARKLAQGLAGHLTLGYASSIALSDLFTEAIRLFRERHPEVQLELLEGASAAQWAQIAEGGIDVGWGACRRRKARSASRCWPWAASRWWWPCPTAIRWRGKSGSTCTICVIGR